MKIPAGLAFGLFFAVAVLGQISPSPQFEGKVFNEIVQQQYRFLYGDNDMRRGTRRSGVQFPSQTRRTTAMPRGPSSALLKARKVSDGSLAEWNALLNSPNTGIFRLLKTPTCEPETYSFLDACRKTEFEFWHYGESYSFLNRKHDQPLDTQISLWEGKLISSGRARQTILTDLGDVKLEDLSLISNGVKYLSAFQPALEIAAVEAQWQAFNKIVDADGYRFMQSLWVRTSSTYALRSIQYKFGELNRGKHWDTTVVFRVASVETDGITVVYRVLEKKKAPELKY